MTREAWGVGNLIRKKFDFSDYYTTISAGGYVNIFIKWAKDRSKNRPTPLMMGEALATFFELPAQLKEE